MKLKTYIPSYVILLLLISIYYYYPSFSSLPRGHHSWAQSDRLALAVGFLHNGFNFFKPATLYMGSANGICGVEFPLQAWLVALFSKLIGEQYIHIVYKVFSICISAYFCWFVFRFLYQKTGNFILSIFPILFLWANPEFAFFVANYLPDPVAVCIALAAFAFQDMHRETGESRYGYYSLLTMTLAVLMKMSLGFYFVVLIGLQMLLFYQKKQPPLKYLLGTGLGFALIGGQYLYIHHLDFTYNSGIFLAEPQPLLMPVHEIYTYFMHTLDLHGYSYFTQIQMQIGLAVLVLTLVLGMYFRKDIKWDALKIAGQLMAATLTFLVMGKQFEGHDYYFMSCFLILAVTLVSTFSLLLSRFFSIRSAKWLLSLVLIAGMALELKETHQKIINFTYDPNYLDWLFNNPLNPREVELPENAFVVFNSVSYAPNLGLVYFNRPGLPTNIDFKSDFSLLKKYATDLNVFYFVLSKESEKDMLQYFKDLNVFAIKYFDAGNYSIYCFY